MEKPTSEFKFAVLISGNGSNLQAMIDAIAANQLSAKLVAVISDRADAYGLVRASKAGIPTFVIPRKDYPTRQDHDQAILEILAAKNIDLIVLAGYMRLLSPMFVHAYENRIINIHPALLPKYRGLDTYQRVLASGDKQHGTSVHIVTEDLDAGPIIAQAACEIDADDDEASLKQRVQQLEHIAYPTVIQWLATGRIKVRDGQVYFDDEPITQPISLALTT